MRKFQSVFCLASSAVATSVWSNISGFRDRDHYQKAFGDREIDVGYQTFFKEGNQMLRVEIEQQFNKDGSRFGKGFPIDGSSLRYCAEVANEALTAKLPEFDKSYTGFENVAIYTSWPPASAADWKINLNVGKYDFHTCKNGMNWEESTSPWSVESFNWDDENANLKLNVVRQLSWSEGETPTGFAMPINGTLLWAGFQQGIWNDHEDRGSFAFGDSKLRGHGQDAAQSLVMFEAKNTSTPVDITDINMILQHPEYRMYAIIGVAVIAVILLICIALCCRCYLRSKRLQGVTKTPKVQPAGDITDLEMRDTNGLKGINPQSADSDEKDPRRSIKIDTKAEYNKKMNQEYNEANADPFKANAARNSN